MYKGIIEHTKILTAQDTKSLVGKALKVCEESGELAKYVLSFDGSPGTLHRFVTREKVIEEVCDTILSAWSVAYHLDFSEEEIESMFHRKLAKWADLQANEQKAKFPLPFEIHVTVEQADIDSFKAICLDIGVKPIMLDLHTREGGVMRDLQTSSVHLGDNASVMQELNRIGKALTKAGIVVTREKIETVPFHPVAPTAKNGFSMPTDCYFETHFNIICTDETRGLLKSIADEVGGHLSRNVFKKLTDGAYTLMLTCRATSGTREDFDKWVAGVTTRLKQDGFEVSKIIVEFAIHDTKVAHDKVWLA